MEYPEKEKLLYEQLSYNIDNYCRENNITYASVIGILEFIKNEFIDDFYNIKDNAQDNEN